MRYESDDATERRYAPKVTMVFFLWDWKSYSDLIQIYDALLNVRLFCRYTGIIAGIGDADPMWRGSKWKCLMVGCLFLQDIYAFVTSFFSYKIYMLSSPAYLSVSLFLW